MKKRDIILFGIVAILIVQGVLINKYMNSGQGARVEVYVENKLYNTYPLDKDQKISIKEKNARINNIHIHDKGVEMTKANCPDKVCIHTGFIDKPGQSIVCLPHKINIKIISDDDSQLDKDVIVK
ncbi:MAG: NusG domain II-containing protein [Peptostreptococcus sp.]|nr:NusG domain II-containing protein [Peptostreptococcus sp.]